jgi:hypothetical protein
LPPNQQEWEQACNRRTAVVFVVFLCQSERILGHLHSSAFSALFGLVEKRPDARFFQCMQDDVFNVDGYTRLLKTKDVDLASFASPFLE